MTDYSSDADACKRLDGLAAVCDQYVEVNLTTEDRLACKRGATALRELKTLRADTHINAPWLSEAHALCADVGIPSGHISDRLKALRQKIIDGAFLQSVDVIKQAAELKTLRERCERPCDGYAYRYHSPFGSGMTFIAFEYTEARGKPIESIPYWLGSPSGAGGG